MSDDRLKARLASMPRRRTIQPMKPRPVPGGVAFLLMMAAAAIAGVDACVTDKPVYAIEATIFVVGAAILSVIRMIEGQRRAER